MPALTSAVAAAASVVSTCTSINIEPLALVFAVT